MYVRDVFAANCTFIIFVQHVISSYTYTYASHRRTQIIRKISDTIKFIRVKIFLNLFQIYLKLE